MHATLAQTPIPGPARRGLAGRIRSRFKPPPAPAPVPGLYLWGGVGRGKTYLMDWFAEALPLPGKQRLHFHHLMRDLHEGMAGLPRQPDPLELVAERRCQDLRVLCLDEFVVTDIADATLLHGLLRAFFRRGVTLVTTSNTPPDRLYLNGLQRPLFLPPSPSSSSIPRCSSWMVASITGCKPCGRMAFITMPRRATPMPISPLPSRAWRVGIRAGRRRCMSMGAISRRAGWGPTWPGSISRCCAAAPALPLDYIEIAREFHTVLLSGVPCLTARQDAAARRFLHLVDELYDRRVKLILSAEVPLDELYSGELHEFAHERLTSRLMEMQSTGYLAAGGEARAP